MQFRSEFEKFCEDLEQDTKNQKKLRFLNKIKDANGSLEPDDIVDSAEALLKSGGSSARRVHSCLRSICDPLRNYTKVIDTLVSAYPFPTALIWGGLKIVIEYSGRHVAQFDLIRKEIQELPHELWILAGFDELYATSAYGQEIVQEILSRSYRLIFEFLFCCVETLEHRVLSALTHNRKLDDVVQDIRDSSQKLERVRSAIESRLSSEDRATLKKEAALNAAMRDSLVQDRIGAASERAVNAFEREKTERERQLAEQERQRTQSEREKAEEERRSAAAERQRTQHERVQAELARKEVHSHRAEDALFKQRQQHEQRWQTITSRVEGDNDLNLGTYNTALDARQNGTCQWLLQCRQFQTWLNGEADQPVIWMNGKHGAGKTVLCAAGIQSVREKLHPTLACAFQFFSKDHLVLRNQLLRNIAVQLLSYAQKMSPHGFSESLEPFLTIEKSDSSAVEALLRVLLSELPIVYLFFDGLDEVEYAGDDDQNSKATRNEAPKQLVQFFIREAQKTPEKLRIWCSSQPLPYIQQYVLHRDWQESVQQLHLETHHTEEDIRNCLTSAIETLPEDDQAKFTRIFRESARGEIIEGSFLWVKTMLEDLKERADDDADLFRLAKAGLPRTMSEGYTRIIARLKRGEMARKDGFHLWRLVLSLVTFAKRPLRIGEIIEAVATYRTEHGVDMDHSRLTTPDKVRSCCLSLVSLVSSGGFAMDAHLRLSHSAVRAFLLQHSNHPESSSSDEIIVSSCVIRDCCVQYLWQPRYRQLLCGSTSDGPKTCTDPTLNLKEQRLLSYAAKYWFQHFDDEWTKGSRKLSYKGNETDESGVRARAIEFLRSANYQTCLQIQCLLVEAHFLLKFDRITDEPTCLRRTLPDWLQSVDSTLYQQYNDFQSEWCYLLQSKAALGEVDRCFWQPFDSLNDPKRFVGRYRSFQFKPTNDILALSDNCQIATCSPDGRYLTTAFSTTEEPSDRSRAPLCLKRWELDGNALPKIVEELKVDIAAKFGNTDEFWLSGSESFSALRLIPSIQSIPPLAAAALEAESGILRIGPNFFQRVTKSDASTPYKAIDAEVVGSPWEEAAAHGRYLALCRRKRPTSRQDGRLVREENSRRLQELRDFWKRHPESRAEFAGEFLSALRASVGWDSESSEESDSDESTGDISARSLTDDSSLEHSPAEESWSEGSVTESSSEQSILSHNPNYDTPDEAALQFDEDIDSDTDHDSFNSDASHNSVDSDSSVSAMIDTSSLDSTDTSGSENEASSKENDDWAKALARRPTLKDEPASRVGIAEAERLVWCFGCAKVPLREHFWCIKCDDEGYDLCLGCEKRGRWCEDLRHQMYKLERGRPVDLMSRRKATMRQELAVFCMEEGKERQVFHVRKSYKSFLYESRPVFHPHHPIVVWPLSGSRLLFADYSRNSYLEPKIRMVGPAKAQTICVNVSFSACGTFLRVASVNAAVDKQIIERSSTTAGSVKLTVFLNLNIAVLRLSASKPTRCPPKLVASASYRLGPCAKPVVQRFPFAFTWCPDHLYLTMSDHRLRVFRVSFPEFETADTNDSLEQAELKSAEMTIATPSETVYLPRSSRNRTVQFFPPREPGIDATVIIGPRYGARPGPPIGVYLKEKDLGEWIPIEEGGAGQPSGQRLKLEGQLENFCVDEDCDIIPFD